MSASKDGFFFKKITLDQCKDGGMALVLVALLVAQLGHLPKLVGVAIVLLLLLMVKPGLYRPFARLWFGLSELLGTVMSKVILTLVFFVVVTPIGVLRRALGADAMRLKAWKKDTASVFKVRGETVEAKDVEQLF